MQIYISYMMTSVYTKELFWRNFVEGQITTYAIFLSNPSFEDKATVMLNTTEALQVIHSKFYWTNGLGNKMVKRTELVQILNSCVTTLVVL